MPAYSKPEIWVFRQGARPVPPAFTFEYDEEAFQPIYTGFWWLEKAGASFEPRAVSLLSKAPTDTAEANSVRFNNDTFWVSGKLRHVFIKTFQGATISGREGLLPTEDELKKSLNQKDILDLRRKFPTINETLCRGTAEHFDNAAPAQQQSPDKASFHAMFKGLTIGRSENEPGFLMMAVKGGYQRLGIYEQAYAGVRVSNFTDDDLKAYVARFRESLTPAHVVALLRATAKPVALIEMRDPETWVTEKATAAEKADTAIAANEAPRYTIENPTVEDIHPYFLEEIAKARKHWFALEVAKSKGKKECKPVVLVPGPDQRSRKVTTKEMFRTGSPFVVHEYGFRGDTRPPAVLFEAGGLHPNAMFWDPVVAANELSMIERRLISKRNPPTPHEAARLSAYHDYVNARVRARGKERSEVANTLKYGEHPATQFDPLLHVGELHNALSAFLSVSRAVSVAAQFLGLRNEGTGFIYLVRCEAAIDQLATFNHGEVEGGGPSLSGGEYEISVPGGLDWADVIAYREMKDHVLSRDCHRNELNRWHYKERDVQRRAMAALSALQHTRPPPKDEG